MRLEDAGGSWGGWRTLEDGGGWRSCGRSEEFAGGWTEVGRRLVKAGGRWRRLEAGWRRLEAGDVQDRKQECDFHALFGSKPLGSAGSIWLTT